MPELIREAETELEKSFNESQRLVTPVWASLSAMSSSSPQYIDPKPAICPEGAERVREERLEDLGRLSY